MKAFFRYARKVALERKCAEIQVAFVASNLEALKFYCTMRINCFPRNDPDFRATYGERKRTVVMKKGGLPSVLASSIITKVIGLDTHRSRLSGLKLRASVS